MRAALVGDGIAASLTPAMHEAEGAAQGMAYRYERYDTATKPWNARTLAEILEHAESEGLCGLNVTHPHKTRVGACLDALEGPAGELGTVNTVVLRDGKRIGHTTDYSGFAMALDQRELSVRGARIIQFGAGGAGAATALALLDAGAAVTLVDTAAERASALAARLGRVRPDAPVTVMPPDKVDPSQAEGALNATPIGMKAYPGMPFDPAHLPVGAWVADIVYFPLETALIRRASDLGMTVMNGGAMAVYQAVTAFELLTGHAANADRMQRHFQTLIDRQNLDQGQSVA